MFASQFFRRLFVPYMLLACLAIGAVGLVAAVTLRGNHLETTRQGLRGQILLVARLMESDLIAGRMEPLNTLARDILKESGSRVTLIAADGRVLADSEADISSMENHYDRPEVREADGTGEGRSLRTSHSLNVELLYIARKFNVAGKVYYIRLAAHVTQLNQALNALYAGLATATVLAMVGAGLIGYVFVRRNSRPVLELTQFANALASGDLGRRYLRVEKGEIQTLATALNAMADSLSSLVAQAHDDNERLTTILTSMNEGVIAADTQQHILWTNQSAGKLLGFETAAVNGKLLWEVVRSDVILKAASDVVAAGSRKTFAVGPLAGRHLEVTACTFPPGSPPEGLILVAHDTTQSVQYQELRKEFVANVSHELRTPLSIIKGFAETLRDGAINDPVRARSFLGTIEKHADQLTNLVSDLLELSRLDSQPGLTRKGPVDVSHLLRRVGDLLMPAAQRKKHHLILEAPLDLPYITGNSDYLERAVTNLIDNAIKYTPEEGEIHVTARVESPNLVVEVRDNGIGIPDEEVPRIFERFYRVDRSRSRELGGTGLGLSIVKHVAQVHGGTVDVISTPSAGSTFRLKLPLVRTAAVA